MARLSYPPQVESVIKELKTLPSVGPRSAERIAVWLFQNKKSNTLALSESLIQMHEEVVLCSECGFFATPDHCVLCDDVNRNSSILCVVEQPNDVLPVDGSGVFTGYFHCLGGKLSPLDNVAPSDLSIGLLLKRVEKMPEGSEIVLALSSDIEGDSTSQYLMNLLSSKSCKVTKIAQGMPVGGGLEQADCLTLRKALMGRSSF